MIYTARIWRQSFEGVCASFGTHIVFDWIFFSLGEALAHQQAGFVFRWESGKYVDAHVSEIRYSTRHVEREIFIQAVHISITHLGFVCSARFALVAIHEPEPTTLFGTGTGIAVEVFVYLGIPAQLLEELILFHTASVSAIVSTLQRKLLW